MAFQLSFNCNSFIRRDDLSVNVLEKFSFKSWSSTLFY